MTVPMIENCTNPHTFIQKESKGLAPKKRAMLEALRITLGNISAACEKIGVGRRTYYDWIKNDTEFKSLAKNVPEIINDFVENALFKLIARGNSTATIFFLKTRARDRGYDLSAKPTEPKKDEITKIQMIYVPAPSEIQELEMLRELVRKNGLKVPDDTSIT